MHQSKPHILAIDDTPANLLALGASLTSDFDLQIATSGEMGLKLANEAPPDLILLDIMMPEMDGFEVCRRLKATPSLQHIPVIFVTALSASEAEVNGLALGAADYLTKPIDIEVARQRIRNLLEREKLRQDVQFQRDLLEARNIALQRAQTDLIEAESFKRAILDSLAELIAVVDLNGFIQAANAPWQLFAQERAAKLGLPYLVDIAGSSFTDACNDLVGIQPPEKSKAVEGIRSVLAGTQSRFSMDIQSALEASSEWFTMTVSALDSGTQRGAVIALTNISERKNIEEQLTASEAHLQAIIEHEPECIKIVDRQGLLKRMNPAGLALIEATSLEQVAGLPMLNMVAPEHQQAFADLHQRVMGGQAAQLEFEVIGLKGGRRWLETHATPMIDHGETVHLAVTRDVTLRKQMQERINQLAFHDALTGLPNRRLLSDRVGQAMLTSKRSGKHAAMLLLDLDNFKVINDQYGHEIGDLLLVEVAARLKRCVREMDTVARFGGDEFVVVLAELTDDLAGSVEQAELVAEKIRLALSETYALSLGHDAPLDNAIEHTCTASVGVALFLGDDSGEADILKRADMAMYQAKHAGRNGICFDQMRPSDGLAPVTGEKSALRRT